METKKEMKKQAIKIGVFVLAIVVLGVSLSYAFFTANLSGEAEIPDVNTSGYHVSSSLENASAINNSKMTLIDAANVATDADKVSFTVENDSTSNVNARYFIYLTDVKLSKNLYSKYFKWELLRETASGLSPITNGDFSTATRSDTAVSGEADNVVTTVEEINLNKVALVVAKGVTDRLVFRIWLENDPNVNQMNLTEGSFEGKLKIEASAVKP